MKTQKVAKTIINEEKCNTKVVINLLLNNICRSCIYASSEKNYCNHPSKTYHNIPKENTCENFWKWGEYGHG